MATIRRYQQCEVCGAVTIIRTQIGREGSFPLRYHCGTCGIAILGTVTVSLDPPISQFEFTNAKQVFDPTEAAYHLEASSELLVAKVAPHVGPPDTPMLSPFIDSMSRMGHASQFAFAQRVGSMLGRLNDWPSVRRINELWHRGQLTYLPAQVHQYLDPKQFPASNRLECLRAAHQVTLLYFLPALEQGFMQKAMDLMRRVHGLHGDHGTEMLGLIARFQESGQLARFESRLFEQLDHFVKLFPYLIPAFSVRFYEQGTEDLFETKGMTTATFEDLKQFYIDSYEVAGEIAELVAACNNLAVRGSLTKARPKRKDIATLDDYVKKHKGIRLELLDGEEPFDHLVVGLDGHLRNAIGHKQYEYDGLSQRLTYWSNPEALSPKAMYLAEFGMACLDAFSALFRLWELTYQLRKVPFALAGDTIVHPSVFGPVGVRALRRVRREEQRLRDKQLRRGAGRGEVPLDKNPSTPGE